MKIFDSLIQTAPGKTFASLLLGSLAGIAYTFLIPIVVNSFSGSNGFKLADTDPVTFLSFEVSNYRFAALFGLACLVIFATRSLSQVILSRVAIDAASKLRIKYYKAIIDSPLFNLEQVGPSRLIASFTTDIKTIIQGAMALPDLLISGVTIFGMMGFLLYLNADIFYFIVGAIGFGALTYMIPMILVGKFFQSTRNKADELQEAVRGNIYGNKELKLCDDKRRSFFDDILLPLEKEVRDISKTAVTIVRSASNYGDMVSFFVIGFVAFILMNYHSITQSELLTAVMILLYITAPISIVMNSLPEIINANISLVKVETLFNDLPQEQISREIKTLSWQQLRFEQVTYKYQIDGEDAQTAGDTDDDFAVGPIDLTVSKGEVTFIVGGNGSGKSTLSKLIATYYKNKTGKIYLDDQLLDASLVASYRHQISAIYTDYYLFDRLLGSAKDADPQVIEKYMEQLHLTHKVDLKEGVFSTLSLSDGQRKRLALLIAFLEEKSLYIFDEWAADQDPEFKKVFYFDILPLLKKQGKAVIVISHDDRYFDVADRVITMENGQVKSNVYIGDNEQPSSAEVAQCAAAQDPLTSQPKGQS